MGKDDRIFWWIIIIVVILIGFLAVLSLLPGGTTGSDNDNENGDEEISWLTYRSDEFNFEIDYPEEGWIVEEFPGDQIAPRVNFYRAGQNVSHPVTHHSEASNVSVFPSGVPTEGVSGETDLSQVEFSLETEEATDFILDNGEVWATFASFAETPDSWGQSGFIWSKAGIQNLEITCLRNGQEVFGNQCDPLLGDTLVRSGSVNESEREVQVSMLESFRFVE